ncbi:MAG: oligopeptide transporter, OPT family [Gammaproteobacteria bacterium RIFCSPHIGHO2_12_FULL_45_9]|nr:MAG: oligopeptide transporter, OPT family [Gammaproteobacteria bacterium RIFCSPHIGHO2_12_FULL_45_9]
MPNKNNSLGTNSSSADEPVIPASCSLPEITWRVLVLGTLLTIILAAANAFLGLKVGNTVSASIPAAVISMGILRFFRNSNILENNMVQIMASVGESLTAGIAFILPALIILHVWDGFNYWQTVAVGLVGGGLGVLFTIPLRRALLQDKTLRYPEGVAIGNVLKASANREKGDLNALTTGGLIGSFIALCQSGFQVLADSFQFWVKGSTTIFGFGLGFSPALVAAGYIVGVNVALSLLTGVIIGWVLGVPLLSNIYGLPQADTVTNMAMVIWRSHIRYIGVGTMLVGGLWTLCTLFKPVAHSIATSVASLRDIKLGKKVGTLRTERDIPVNYVLWGLILLLVPLFFIIAFTIIPSNSGISNSFRYLISGVSTLYVLFGGFIFCSVMAYFAGLIGSTNSPVSGLLVSSLLVLCLIFLVLFGLQAHTGADMDLLGVIVAVGSTAIIGAALAISNDTMQDLKVGQIVGSTPWKQQVMLILGVVVSAFVVPPILQLLYNAYGIGGVFPRPGMNPAQMLSAPQAGLMAAVAKGVFSHNLEWGMIATGAVIAVLCIVIDEVLKQFGTRLPVLAVGLGIYLPLDSSTPVIIGGLLSYLVHIRLNRMYHRGKPDVEVKIQSHRHRGLLLCCGIVAGASLMGVVLAIPFAIKESSDALRIMPAQLQPFAGMLSIVVTTALCVWIYRVVMRKSH